MLSKIFLFQNCQTPGIIIIPNLDLLKKIKNKSKIHENRKKLTEKDKKGYCKKGKKSIKL